MSLFTGPLAAMLRDLALTRLGKSGDEETVAEAKKRFEDHVTGKSPLPADLKGPVRDSHLSLSLSFSLYLSLFSLYLSTLINGWSPFSK